MIEVAAGVNLAGLFEQGVRGAVDFAKHLVSVGLEAQRQEQVFEKFTEAIGVNAKALTAAMETASRGLADVGETMVAQQQLLKAGFQPDQIVGLMESAFARAAASGKDVTEVFNQMATAIAQAKAKGVESVGVLIDQEAAMDAYAQSIGKATKDLTEADKAQAIYAATIKATRGEVEQFGQAQLNMAQMWAKVTLALSEFIEGIGVGLVGAIQSGVDWLMTFGSAWDAFTAALSSFASGLGTQLKGALTGVWEGLKALGDILGPILIPLLTAAGQAIGGALVLGLLALQAALLTVVPPLVYLASVMKDIANGSIPDLAKANEAANASFAKLEAGLKASATAAGQMAGVLPAAATSMDKTGTAADTMGRSIVKAGEAAGPTAEQLKRLAKEADKIDDALTKAGQKLAGLATAFGEASAAQKISVEFENIARALDGINSDKARQAAEQIREMGKAAVALEEGKQKLKEFGEEVKRLEVITTTFDNLQKSIDAIHMTDAEKELAAFSAELDKIGIRGHEAQRGLLETAAGLIAARDAAAAAKKELQDAAKYMQELGGSAETATAPLSNLGAIMGDVETFFTRTGAAMKGLNFSILTDDLGPLEATLKNVSVELEHLTKVAALSAEEMAILTDSLQPLKDELNDKAWAKFGDGLKGMFKSVGDTFEKITTGLIQGTLDIDEAFKNLGQSLLVNFAKTVFNSILDQAQSFVDDFIDTIVKGLQNFDWGGFFSDLFSFIGGFFGGGGGGGGGGGNWLDVVDFDFYAHGGRVRRTGPAVLHEGETVIPAGFGEGWQSPGLTMPRGSGGGTIPVHVENVDAFGQQFGNWAGKIIQATPLALQGLGMLTGSSGLSGAGSGLGILGGLKTAYGLYQGGYQFGDYLSPQSIGSLASGAGSVLSLIGGLTGSPGLSYAGMGIQGAVLATQIVSALVPQVASAITGAGATIASSIGGSVGSWAGSAVSGLAGLPSLAAIGPGAVLAIPALAGFFASMGMEEQTRQDIVRRQEGHVYAGDMASRAATIKTMADLDKKYTDAVFGERTPRQDVTMLATWASVGAEQSNQAIITMKRYAQDMGANVDDLTAMEQANMDKMNAFIAKAAQIGVTPDMALLNVSPHTVSPGHGVASPENFAALLDVWTEIINRLVSGTQTIDEGGRAIAVSSGDVADSVSAVVRNQADLIIKYGGTVEALRQISDTLELGVNIPEIMKLTKEQLDFLGTATGQQIEEMITGWKDAIADAIMQDPVKLTGLLDMSKFQRAGESIEQTTERVAESLHGLGIMMKSLDQEIAALQTSGLAGMTLSFTDSMTAIGEGLDAAGTKFRENAIRLDESSGLIGDPTAMLEAAAAAHDLLIARYEAELQLIAQIVGAIDAISGGANALAGTAARLQELGVMPAGGMEFVSFLSEAMSGFFARGPGGGMQTAIGGGDGLIAAPGDVGMAIGGGGGLMAEDVGPFGFQTPEMALAAGRGAVGVFATQSMMAARTMDLAGMEAAMRSAGNLVAGFTATIDQINQIQDPSERMRLLTEALGQVGTATEAAAQAAITYWTTLHDTVAGMMAELNSIASSIAGAGSAVASNADWLMKAGVDVKALGADMLGLIELFPTMGAKLELLGSGIQTFIAGISKQEMDRLGSLGAQYLGATGQRQQDIGAQITTALQPVLTGIFNSFTAAMALQDPGQRMAALTGIMDTVGKLLGGLPPELADALTKMFGPEIGKLVEEMKRAAKEQAEHAAKVAEELKKIMGDKALSPENFLLMTVQGIKDSLALIVTHAGPLFEKIADGMVKAGGDINDAINTAGIALSNALGGFKTPAEQLANSLDLLRTTMYQTMKDAVKDGIDAALSGSGQSGIGHVPETGLYMLHQGEGVLTAEQNAAFNRGVLGSYASGTFVTTSTVRGLQTLLEGISRAVTTILPAAFTQVVAAWQITVTAYGNLIDIIGAGWTAVGGAYGNLMSIISAGWNAMPTMMADAVTVGINDALSARGLAGGTDYVPTTGIYKLHQGEAVIPAAQNAQRGPSGGGGVAVTLQFGDIHLARGGRQEAEEFISTIAASIQHGRLRGAVQRAAVGQA